MKKKKGKGEKENSLGIINNDQDDFSQYTVILAKTVSISVHSREQNLTLA